MTCPRMWHIRFKRSGGFICKSSHSPKKYFNALAVSDNTQSIRECEYFFLISQTNYTLASVISH